ncbi:MAG: hypothetical protein K2H52_18325 [Lachnospiraceae bacterium]|nr:hypothetical protein [Lachnospiraceae bacterium]MDE6184481.1 hypothetical protein [Lachnospiraceae bacterium]
MVQFKEDIEHNIHTYDEDMKWQLAKLGTLMSAKNYSDKKEVLFVERKNRKSLTIQCRQLTEQIKEIIAFMKSKIKKYWFI